jgi:F0F1-type ATP synthase alpha subunit
VAIIYAGSRGYMDKVEVEKINEWERDFLRYMDTARADVLQPVRERGRLER